MGLEAATYINQLVATNPVGAVDPKSQGDDHLRLIKATLQASFPNITGAMTATHTQLNALAATGFTGFAAAANSVKPSGAAAGTATTALRSDAQLVLDLTAAYNWTAAHSFASSVTIANSDPLLNLTDTSQGLDAKRWALNANGTFDLYAVNDAASIFKPTLTISRSGVVITNWTFGNGTDNPTYTFNSSSAATFNGTVNVSRAAGTAAQFSALVNAVENINLVANNTAGTVGGVAAGKYGLGTAAGSDISFSLGGTVRGEVKTAGFSTIGTFAAGDGSVAGPAFTFTSDPDTGFYRWSADAFAATSGGAAVMSWRLGQTRINDGSAGAPALTFENDTDTGFYRDTSNQLAIALGGVTAGQIAQGTYTATLTGCTTSPTVTVNWQRVGKFIELWINSALTATSNSGTMTITGGPAIISPTSNKTGLCAELNDNGSADLIGKFSMSSGGTVTFHLLATGVVPTRVQAATGGFTASGTKGLSAGWRISYPVD